MDTDAFKDQEEGRAIADENEEVMQALLIHEKKSAAAALGGGSAPSTNAGAGSDSDSDTSESDQDSPASRHPVIPSSRMYEEDDDDDEFEEVTSDLTVTVGGRPFLYSEVSQRPELVAQMTPLEKEAYIEMGKKMFEDLYD
ncbi:general transcription factor IIE subunit 1 [Pelobates cultripes]|uniref:General transcription factor IIE subunit 1 n=1 Tax=Pelobates cultripes TaxID=61616 RepID=A0AAD1QWF8_PELCU|nr:general transcription factor IIE subunit 1 [Pelobates cultripes]